MVDQLNRRTLLAGALTAPAVLQLGAGRTFAQPAPRKPDFFFLVAADPQLFWGPLELWEKAIAQANRLKPAFMVVCGDLVQDPGDDKQARAYLKAAGKLDPDIPLYQVAGNHDVTAKPTPETLAWYQGHFGDPWYSFEQGSCLFVALESDVLNRPEGAPQAAEQQMTWLKETLAKASREKPSHVMVFKHYPLCLKSVDEPSHYFNVPSKRRKELLDLFEKHRVRAVFSGHYHRNARVKYKEIELITTSSCGKPLGKDPTGLRIVKVFPDRIEHAYYGYDDVPEKVAK